MVPPAMVSSPSLLAPLPPVPELLSVSEPPSITILPLLFRQADALVSFSSVSYMPLPEVVIVYSPPLIVINPSHFIPFAAADVTLMIAVPSSKITSPFCSSVASSVAETAMPSSATPSIWRVPPFMWKY